MSLSRRAAQLLRGLLVGAAMSAVPAAAIAAAPSADSAQAKRIVTAFKDWAGRWGVPNGSIAVMKGTTLTGSGGFGSYSANKIEPVASESKAITAVCITQLVEAGRLSFSEQLGKVLKSYFQKNPPLDVRIKSITIGELLTHSSGMTYDPSQANQGGAIEQLPHNKTNLRTQVGITWSHSLGYTPGTTYDYNNMNYAVLGFIIERLTGQAYERYCGASVLQPVGIADAKLNPDWRVMASWGGWKISPKDYVRFLEYYLPSMHLLSIPPAQWPQFDLGGGAYYTLGTAMRQAGSGYNFWHAGSWQWNSDSFGAYFTVIQENVRYMADYAPTVSNDAVNDLDASLYNAATAAPMPPGFDKAPGLARGRTDLLQR
jgi:CubicO group peptidase (beta-lactamase class C family)